MPVKGTKLLEAVKKTTVISTYTTGALVAPAAGHLSVYVDLAAADQHRFLEVANRLEDLINRAREENYRRPAASTTCYYYVYLKDSKAGIVFTTTSTAVVEGMVAIGIHADVRSGSRGSILLDSCWKGIIEWLGEQDRLTV